MIVEQGIVMPDANYRLVRVGSLLHQHGRRMAIVDAADYDNLWWRNWTLRRGSGGNYYAATSYQGKTVEMHRLILGITDSSVFVDHLDGFGLNNRRYNLNPTTAKGNVETRKVWLIEFDRATGKHWVIVMAVDGTETRLGPYDSYSAAHHERYCKRDYWRLWE